MKHLTSFCSQYGIYILIIPLLKPGPISPTHLILEIKGDKTEKKVTTTLGTNSWAGHSRLHIEKDKVKKDSMGEGGI